MTYFKSLFWGLQVSKSCCRVALEVFPLLVYISFTGWLVPHLDQQHSFELLYLFVYIFVSFKKSKTQATSQHHNLPPILTTHLLPAPQTRAGAHFSAINQPRAVVYSVTTQRVVEIHSSAVAQKQQIRCSVELRLEAEQRITKHPEVLGYSETVLVPAFKIHLLLLLVITL